VGVYPMIREGTFSTYKRAWLITWDWMGNHAKVDDSFVAVLDYRYSGESMKRFVEWVYVSSQFAFHEQLAYAKDRSYNPYPAQFGTVGLKAREGLQLPPRSPYEGEITCGRNPWLWARIVYDLEAYVDEDGNEHLRWRQRLHTRIENGELKSDWEECELIR